jgi:hypothetical protein
MHSSLVQKPVDYQVDFSDCQRLEKLLENLSLSQEILRTIEQTVCMFQNSNNYGTHLDDCEPEQELGDLHQMSRHVIRIQGYMRTASALQQRVERTLILVSLLTLG